MASQTESDRLCDILVGESNIHNLHSRQQITVLSGESLAVGEVVGKVLQSTPTTGTADGGNTGNGTCTLVTGGADTKKGTYTLECVAAAANGGTFKVTDPDGAALPDAVVGTAYVNDQINFTLNDGASDFVVGDKFTIDVADGSGKVVAIDFAAVDGSQDAAGFAIDAYDASAADLPGVIIVRDATVREDALVWPGGATAAQIAGALAQLEAMGIVARESA